jgi:hypothetical protein
MLLFLQRRTNTNELKGLSDGFSHGRKKNCEVPGAGLLFFAVVDEGNLVSKGAGAIYALGGCTQLIPSQYFEKKNYPGHAEEFVEGTRFLSQFRLKDKD